MKWERLLWLLVVAIVGGGVYTWQQRAFTPRCAVLVDQQLASARASSRPDQETEMAVFLQADTATSRITLGVPRTTTVGADTYIAYDEQIMDFEVAELLVFGGNFSGGADVLNRIESGQQISYVRERSAGEGGLDRVLTIYVPLP